MSSGQLVVQPLRQAYPVTPLGMGKEVAPLGGDGGSGEDNLADCLLVDEATAINAMSVTMAVSPSTYDRAVTFIHRLQCKPTSHFTAPYVRVPQEWVVGGKRIVLRTEKMCVYSLLGPWLLSRERWRGIVSVMGIRLGKRKLDRLQACGLQLLPAVDALELGLVCVTCRTESLCVCLKAIHPIIPQRLYMINFVRRWQKTVTLCTSPHLA
jgi:hypothetical protein